MDEFRFVRMERRESTALLTIDRQEKLNALNADVLEELAEAVTDAFVDDDVRAIVITGAGDKSFVAGADIDMLAEQDVLEGRQNSLVGQDVMETIEDGPKPVIAAVNGYALGGGCELALACDFRIASTNAVFGLPEVGLGIIPGYGGTQRLPRLVGTGHALELIMTGGKIDAHEAQRIGLVNRVAEPDALIDEALKCAAKIAKVGPIAVEFAKQAVRRGMLLSLKDGFELEADLFGMISSTADMKEGMQAFLEKRKPQFRGK
ncbi:MAG: enoyl-CoA hydratase/isomerase family protein [Planctomycetes bacterium]|nr:enoyl-CoA hydratase/isomerase family protein [Planctomycetota bacterium]MCB9916904.1 enoyl-CoA hydratase/isomerase family protein [Planctomycetota bacterium]